MDTGQTVPARPGTAPQLCRHDYVSPGMTPVILDAAFPDMIVGDMTRTNWPFLRRWVEHNWYVDRNDDTTGFANRDEVMILYNNARLFAGQSALEIGCWRGWSTAHIALAIGTGTLDVIDPIIGDRAVIGQIRQSLAAAGVLDRVRLHSGYSPEAVTLLADEVKQRWSFAFIDGNHDDDAPRRDAEAVSQRAADTAMVMFHDLASPHVAAGLRAMRDAGWNVMLYQTMQIMGVAWRGDVEPMLHHPDPDVFWTLPRHLADFAVSGWAAPSLQPNTGWWTGMTMEDRRDLALIRAQSIEDDLLEVHLRPPPVASDDGAAAGHAARDVALAQAATAESARLALVSERDDLLEKVAALEQKVEALTLTRAAQETRVQALRSVCQELADHQTAQAQVEAAMTELARWLARRRVLAGLLRRAGQERIAIVRRRASDIGIGHMVSDEAIIWTVRRRTLLGLLRRSAASAEALIDRKYAQEAQAIGREAMERIAAPARDATLTTFLERYLRQR